MDADDRIGRGLFRSPPRIVVSRGFPASRRFRSIFPMGSAPPIIGLCGGIGSGKSRVAREFERLGCVVIDSDLQNHEVLNLPTVQRRLRDWWGDEMIGPTGETNRERLRFVFKDPAARRRLESLVWPLIDERRKAMIQQVSQDPSIPAIILDSPLLFESGLDRTCDRILFVHADQPVRYERLTTARGWSEADIRQRERWQDSCESKRARADLVVENNPGDELAPQLKDVLRKLER